MARVLFQQTIEENIIRYDRYFQTQCKRSSRVLTGKLLETSSNFEVFLQRCGW